MEVAEYTGHNTSFSYISPDSLQIITTLVVTNEIDEAAVDLVQSKLKRMADWYMDYIMWQDRETNGKAGESGFLEDYNINVPQLKIINSTKYKR